MFLVVWIFILKNSRQNLDKKVRIREKKLYLAKYRPLLHEFLKWLFSPSRFGHRKFPLFQINSWWVHICWIPVHWMVPMKALRIICAGIRCWLMRHCCPCAKNELSLKMSFAFVQHAQLHCSRPELRLCAGSNLTRGMSLRYWESPTTVPAGNKINRTTKNKSSSLPDSGY